MTPIEAIEADIDPQEIIDQGPPPPPPYRIPTVPADFVTALGKLAEPAKSGKVNAGQRRYTYLTLPDLLEAVRAVFAAHNLAVTQSVIRDGDYAVCTTTVWHTSGWSYTTEPLINRCSPGIQDLGSASTYLRRYSLATLVGLAGSEDDDGARAQHGSTPATRTGVHAPKGTNATTEGDQSLPPVDPETGEILEARTRSSAPEQAAATDKQKGTIRGLARKLHLDGDQALEEIRNVTGHTHVDQLDKRQASDLIKHLQTLVDLAAHPEGQADG